jgi:hypothetical protein
MVGVVEMVLVLEMVLVTLMKWVSGAVAKVVVLADYRSSKLQKWWSIRRAFTQTHTRMGTQKHARRKSDITKS